MSARPPPHAPETVADAATGLTRTFAYDADGNQTHWSEGDGANSRDNAWDDEEPITSITDKHTVTGTANVTSFIYNAAGRRTYKASTINNARAFYPNQWISARMSTLEGTGNLASIAEHIYAGNERVASSIQSLAGFAGIILGPNR